MVWSRRYINESHSVALGERIAEYSPGPAIKRLIDDERTHVELAGAFLDRLGAARPEVPPFDGITPGDTPRMALFRAVLTGLTVCESVSAARFTAVRAHTDLPIARACIEYFLRDEIAHAELGFLLLPAALENIEAQQVEAELSATFRTLELAIGLDAERKKLELRARPQLPMNAGVVEPAIDALAFYECVERSILPKLEKSGLDARGIWSRRWLSKT